MNNEKKNNELEEAQNVQVQDEVKIQVYKWLKILQALILVMIGVIFVVISQFNDNGSSQKALSISLGVVLAIYGLIDVVAGYILNRSVIAQEILIGILFLSFALVLFLQNDIIEKVLSTLMIGVLFGYGALLIVYGVDRILGRQGMKKNIPIAVFSFLGAAILIGAAVVYLYFSHKEEGEVMKWMMMIVGAVLIVLGIICLVLFLIKLRNTRKFQKEEKERQEKEAEEAKRDEQEEQETKVIKYDDLKKEDEDKEKNNAGNTTTIVVTPSGTSSEEEKKPEENQPSQEIKQIEKNSSKKKSRKRKE